MGKISFFLNKFKCSQNTEQFNQFGSHTTELKKISFSKIGSDTRAQKFSQNMLTHHRASQLTHHRVTK